MKILVFGASGATGQELVKEALAQDHRVTAFVRSLDKISLQHARLRVVQGDVSDAVAVSGAVVGHDAVFSALGVAKSLSPDPAVVEGIRNIVCAMEEAGIGRLIYLSFIGVTESRPAAGFVIKYLISRLVRHEITDHETKEEIIRRSRLSWSLLRPPKLTHGPFTGQYNCGEGVTARALLPTLSRADVAHAMLRTLIENSFDRKAVNLMHRNDSFPLYAPLARLSRVR